MAGDVVETWHLHAHIFLVTTSAVKMQLCDGGRRITMDKSGHPGLVGRLASKV